jgi:hypothetical protein
MINDNLIYQCDNCGTSLNKDEVVKVHYGLQFDEIAHYCEACHSELFERAKELYAPTR